MLRIVSKCYKNLACVDLSDCGSLDGLILLILTEPKFMLQFVLHNSLSILLHSLVDALTRIKEDELKALELSTMFLALTKVKSSASQEVDSCRRVLKLACSVIERTDPDPRTFRAAIRFLCLACTKSCLSYSFQRTLQAGLLRRLFRMIQDHQQNPLVMDLMTRIFQNKLMNPSTIADHAIPIECLLRWLHGCNLEPYRAIKLVNAILKTGLLSSSSGIIVDEIISILNDPDKQELYKDLKRVYSISMEHHCRMVLNFLNSAHSLVSTSDKTFEDALKTHLERQELAEYHYYLSNVELIGDLKFDQPLEKLAQVEHENTRLQQKIEQMQCSLRARDSQILELQLRLSDHEYLQNMIKGQKYLISRTQKDIADLNANIEFIGREAQHAMKPFNFEGYKIEISTVIQQLCSEIEDLKTGRLMCAEEGRILQQSLEETRTELFQRATMIASLEHQVSAMKQKLDDFEAKYRESNTKLHEMEERIVRLETNEAQLHLQLDSSRRLLQMREEQIKLLRAEIQSISAT